MNAVPLWACARCSISCRWFASTSMVRATKVAPAPSANAIGSIGWSITPCGDDLLLLPSREVGEYWPLVRP